MLLMATIPVAFHGDADAAIRLTAMVMAMELAMKSPPSGQTQNFQGTDGVWHPSPSVYWKSVSGRLVGSGGEAP